jgi:N-acylneuraminate cytidylyltransferase/CMP-N,N'-diacetyllegionaminic acid synthase
LINSKKVLAIVTARGGSKGLPDKNIKPLIGEPLVSWPIKAANKCNEIDRIILSTDSSEIAKIGISAGAEVLSLRPEHLADDKAKSVDTILHVIDECEEKGDYYDYVVLLEPTSPLTEAADITNALNNLEDNRDNADSIVGISSLEATHPEYSIRKRNNNIIEPAFSKSFRLLKRRQEIEELFFLEGSLYISDINSLKENLSFYHSKTMGYQVPRWKSFEVDELIDFICIEAIIKHYNVSKLED